MPINFGVSSSHQIGVESSMGKRRSLREAVRYLCRIFSSCWSDKYELELELKKIFFFCIMNQHLIIMFLLDASAVKVQIMHEIDVHYSIMN